MNEKPTVFRRYIMSVVDLYTERLIYQSKKCDFKWTFNMGPAMGPQTCFSRLRAVFGTARSRAYPHEFELSNWSANNIVHWTFNECSDSSSWLASVTLRVHVNTYPSPGAPTKYNSEWSVQWTRHSSYWPHSLDKRHVAMKNKQKTPC